MAELGSTNVNGDLRVTGDQQVGENINVEGNSETKGEITEKGNRVYSPNNRNISDSVTSSNSVVFASSKSAKTAYDRGTTALNAANTKLGATAKSVDSDKLDGLNSTQFLRSDISPTLNAGTNTTLTIKSGETGISRVEAIGSTQGTGVFYAGQSTSHGGGMSYNGDNNPNWVGDTDHIVFFRTDNGVNTAVFDYHYNSSVVDFKSSPTVNGARLFHTGNDGAGSGLDADLLDGQQGAYYAKASQVLTNVPAGAKFTDTQRALSSAVNSTSSTVAATSAAAKTAYDRGTTALNTANTKLGATAKAVDSDKLSGLGIETFARLDRDIFTSAGTIGSGNGKTALTSNDGLGNSNVTFNHSRGVPVQDGNAARIEVNTDSLVNASFNFELGDNVKANTTTSLTTALNINLTQMTYKGNAVWHAGNDGAGSGLDADLLDGLQASQFLRSDVAVNQIIFGSSAENNWDGIVYDDSANSYTFLADQNRDTTTTTALFRVAAAGNDAGITYRGNKIYHSANDGAGSGLDADLLDGQQGTYYAKASQVLTNVPAGAKFTDTQRALSSAINSTSSTVAATSAAAKTAYDRGTTALNAANTKLDANAKAVDSDKLSGTNGDYFVSGDNTLGVKHYTDLNTDYKAGFFDANNGVNSPFTEGWTWGVKLGHRGNSPTGNKFGAQIVVNNTASPKIMFRSQSGAGTGTWNDIFHTGNHGSGSGLDADKLDGYQGSDFVRKAEQDYNTQDQWLRQRDDKSHVKVYGNSRSLVMRTDGTTQYGSSIGTFPFVWLYGGDGANNRLMLVSDEGDLWLKKHGTWLEDLLDAKLGKTEKAADSNRLGGFLLSTSQTQYTVPFRDASGDIYARLFRSTYQNQDVISGGMAFRVSTTDNYIRFCTSQTAIRNFLSVYSKAEVDARAGYSWVLLRNGSAANTFISAISLAGKEVCFVSTDNSGTNQINVAKAFIPPITGYSNDTNYYVSTGDDHIEYDYTTREVRTFGDYENHQLWYRTPATHDYPPMGTLNRNNAY